MVCLCSDLYLRVDFTLNVLSVLLKRLKTYFCKHYSGLEVYDDISKSAALPEQFRYSGRALLLQSAHRPFSGCSVALISVEHFVHQQL